MLIWVENKKKDGLRYPFVCNGNINCYYEIEEASYIAIGSSSRAKSSSYGGGGGGADDDALPVWAHYWGSLQTGAPPGQLQVTWLWEPVRGGDDNEA